MVRIRYFYTNYTNSINCNLLPLQVSVLALTYSTTLIGLDYTLARLSYKTIVGSLIISLVLSVLL